MNVSSIHIFANEVAHLGKKEKLRRVGNSSQSDNDIKAFIEDFE